ncbi:hypothetical protein SDC9_80715 [bioreactor metagenome]|uniref:Uncharacterized protein n=1 Tax=bioreactor metagenome TaxID=1076179 RepID=A0A644Z5X7_9ZZZZ
MRAIPVHMPVTFGNAPVAHGYGHLLQGFRKGGPEIPVVLSRSHVRSGIALDRMVEIGKEHRISEEEHRGVVSYQIPVPFLGVILHGKTTDVALCIGGTALTCHC